MRKKGMWRIEWEDEEQTEGVVLRQFDYPGLPPAPAIEGKITVAREDDTVDSEET